MAGRREQQKLIRSERILRAAADRFGTRGYAGTCMEEVAADANLAVGTLYNYFRSKSELLMAILRRETDELLAAGQRVVDTPPEDPIEAITAVIEAYLGVYTHHDRELWRDLVALSISEPAGLGATAFQGDARLVGQLASLLRKLRARGSLGQDVEAGRAAIMLFGLYFAWFLVFLLAEEITIERLRDEIRRGTEIAIRGLLPPAGERDRLAREEGSR